MDTHPKTEPNHDLVAKGLAQLLASTYSLYLKTQNFHWNVTGNLFGTLHLLFDEQYKALAEAIDLIAEHIRSIGYFTPASFTEYKENSKIKDALGEKRSAETMLSILAQDHLSLIELIKEVSKIAEDALDEATLDLLNERLRAHEKNAWMLQSFLA